MKPTGLKLALVGCVLAVASAAHATPAGPASTSAQMNKYIGRLCSMELGNGAYAFRAYDPATYSRRATRAQIRSDMRNFERKGVTFKTVAGIDRVKAELAKNANTFGNDLATMLGAIDGFQRLGVLQDVVYRGLVGGPAVGDTYFSIPHQVFFCLKTPSNRGKRLEVFMEHGD
ncbi:MAG: hypothetical protein IT371_04735 [Deltaproteobacteria bacterium]|nr:hypothetical protein [Deltaproteobacteria bacterium]